MYSRMDQVTFFKGYLPQMLLGPLTQMQKVGGKKYTTL